MSSGIRAIPGTQRKKESTFIQDWKWLAFQCEKNLSETCLIKDKLCHATSKSSCHYTIDQFACFVPRIVLEAIADRRISFSVDFDVVIEEFNAAVVFCDASGFTALTEALDKEPNGAEKLGECINSFFKPLIQIVSYWGGDIIKFSGDAITIVWPVDDTCVHPKKFSSQKHRSSDPKNLDKSKNLSSSFDPPNNGYYINSQVACRLACQCCLDLHFNLNMFPTPVAGKFFSVHIGVGFGHVTILQVGGTLDRWEYVVAGPPLEEIAIAEPLANSGETVISPAVIYALGDKDELELVYIPTKNTHFKDKRSRKSVATKGYAKLIGLKGEKVPPPPPLASIELNDTDITLLQRFIPTAIFKRLTAGHNVFINELRRVSVIFVGIQCLDVSTTTGSHEAQKLMLLAQRTAYTMEGSVNKFLVDDKGVMFLIMFGLPPVYHLDDALRAVMTALRIVDGLRLLGLTAGLGVATGRVWCGTVGCWLRKEYTAMGDIVNLAARLMGLSQNNEINCDLETKSLCDHVMDFRVLPPTRMKGKEFLVPIFQPTGRLHRHAILKKITGEPIGTWPRWKYKKKLHQLLFPGYEYLPPNKNSTKLHLDFPFQCSPYFPWEYVEPWSPSLQPTIDLGGVIVIQGKETYGTTELVQYIPELCKILDRYYFACSNMPDSTYVNIANVPMLAWSKLCTEIVETWKNSPGRQKKFPSSFYTQNTTYHLTKELLHPIFHNRVSKLKSVLHGLVLPEDLSPENDMTLYPNILSSTSQHSSSTAPFLTKKNSSIAPLICSLVNGFSMYNPCIISFHVRLGTSLFASVSDESWKIASSLARLAIMRRNRKMEFDLKELKRWRRAHSRGCVWCRGTWKPYKRLDGDIVQPQRTTCCRPLPSKYFPPFLFILVCSEISYHMPRRNEILHFARITNSYIKMTHLTPLESGSYLAHCLSADYVGLPSELVEYVYRVAAGIPTYIYLTARQLVMEQAIVIESPPNCSKRHLMQRIKKKKILKVRRICQKQTVNLRKKHSLNKLILPTKKLIEKKIQVNHFFQKILKRLFFHFQKPSMFFITKTMSIFYYICRGFGPKISSFISLRYQIYAHICRTSDKQNSLFKKSVRQFGSLHVCLYQSRKSLRNALLSNSLKNMIHKQTRREKEDVFFKSTFQNALKERFQFGQYKYSTNSNVRNMKLLEQSDFSSFLKILGRIKEEKKTLKRVAPCYVPPGPDVFNTHCSHESFVPLISPTFPSSYQKQREYLDYKKLLASHVTQSSLSQVPYSFLSSRVGNNKVYNKHVRIIKDLKKVSFVSELRAAAMSLMERLEPDEQLVAKVASIFPVPFTEFEIQAIYPRIISSQRFQIMVGNLIKNEMLEKCDPPTEMQLKELDLFPIKPYNSPFHQTRSDWCRNHSTQFFKKTQKQGTTDDTSDNTLCTNIESVQYKRGHDENHNPIFYRFKSIAFQHVVADLMMSRERQFLAHISRKAIFFRRLYGVDFLIKQINCDVRQQSDDSLSNDTNFFSTKEKRD